MSKIQKRIQIGNQSCLVETLQEWLNVRIMQVHKAYRTSCSYNEQENLSGRLAELTIIREKINDGRIEAIR